jgi:hypothetical protein
MRRIHRLLHHIHDGVTPTAATVASASTSLTQPSPVGAVPTTAISSSSLNSSANGSFSNPVKAKLKRGEIVIG